MLPLAAAAAAAAVWCMTYVCCVLAVQLRRSSVAAPEGRWVILVDDAERRLFEDALGRVHVHPTR